MLSLKPLRVSDIYNELKKSSSNGNESNHPLFKERALSLGCHLIDSITGGIKTQGITEIVGEAGCGKTQCCLVLSLHNHLSINLGGLKGKYIYNYTTVILINILELDIGACAYLSCGEGEFPIRRLSQLALVYQKKYNIPASEFLSNIHIEQCSDSENILDTIASKLPEMCQKLNVTLIIIDSLAGAIRCEYDPRSSKEMKDRTSKLFSFASTLKRLSDAYRVAIVVVNQVTDGGFSEKQESLDLLRNNDNTFLSNSTIPALGLAWSHCINTRIMLRKDDNAVRSIFTMSDSDKENLREQIAICNEIANQQEEFNNTNNTNTTITTNSENSKQYHQEDNSMIPTDTHDSVTFSKKSVRYLTLEFSPTDPSGTIQYEITSDGLRGLRALKDFGAKF